VGEVTRTDVSLSEAALAGAQAGLAVAQGNLTQAIEEFRSAVGRPPGNLHPPRALPRLSGDIEGAKAIAVRTSLATAVTVSVTLSMLWAGYGAWALVVSQVAGSLTVCVLAFWTSGWSPRLTFDRHALWSLAGYGLFSSGTRMLTTMRFDHIVLGALGGTAVLGLYFFAQKAYSMLLQLVGGALSSVTHVLLSTLQRDREKTRRAFRIASFAAAAVSFPGFALLAILAPDLIELAFDPSWGAATQALQLFCIIGCIAGVSVVQGAFIRSQGRADWWFWYQAFQQVTTIVVVLLTFRSGLDVLMTVLTVKSLLVWPISVVMTIRLLGISTSEYLRTFIAPGLTTAVMVGAVILLAQALTEIDPAASLGARVIAAGLVYLAVLWLCAHGRIREIFHLLLRKRETTS